MLLGFIIHDRDTDVFWKSLIFHGATYIWLRDPQIFGDIRQFLDNVDSLCDIHMSQFKHSSKPQEIICMLRDNANLIKIRRLCNDYLAEANIILHHPNINKTPMEYIYDYFAGHDAAKPVDLDLALLGGYKDSYSEREVEKYNETSIVCEYNYDGNQIYDRLTINTDNPAYIEFLNAIGQVPHYQVALRFRKEGL